MNVENKQPQVSESAVQQVSVGHLDAIYQVMIHRIAAGYSAQETAFLMGKPKSYIADKEELKSARFSLDEMNSVAHALRGYSLRSFFFGNCMAHEELTVRKRRTVFDGQIIHEMESVNEEDGSTQSIFKLYEDDPDTILYESSEEKSLELSEKIVSLLFATRWFKKSRDPGAIFRKVCDFTDDPIQPKHLQKVLSAFTRKKSPQRLKRYNAGRRVYMYQETSS